MSRAISEDCPNSAVKFHKPTELEREMTKISLISLLHDQILSSFADAFDNHGLSHKQLAELSGMTASQLSHILNKPITNFKLGTIAKIMTSLGIRGFKSIAPIKVSMEADCTTNPKWEIPKASLMEKSVIRSAGSIHMSNYEDHITLGGFKDLRQYKEKAA